MKSRWNSYNILVISISILLFDIMMMLSDIFIMLGLFVTDILFDFYKLGQNHNWDLFRSFFHGEGTTVSSVYNLQPTAYDLQFYNFVYKP